MARNYRRFTPQEDALLGTDVDIVIGTRLKRALGVIWKRRSALGIRSFVIQKKTKKREWTRKMIRLLGSETDQAIADRLGMTRRAVIHARISREIPPFRAYRKAD